MHFHSPVFLLFLILIPPFLFWEIRRRKSTLKFSSISILKNASRSNPSAVQYAFLMLKYAAFALFILALARPQQIDSEREYETKGIDIVIAMDISGSMLAEDFHPHNRLHVAKEQAKNFIRMRENDRIGLVVFARQSYTQCPMTLDYKILEQLIDDIQIGLIQDGTAIGLGIANSVNRLRDSDAKSKVIILLSDGENNSGNIDPITATELAKSFGIKIYTIAIGRSGLVPYPVDDPIFGKRYVQAQVNVDEKTLKRIADLTGGLYFSATNADALKQIYEKIDKLEKTDIKVSEYTSRTERYPVFLVPGLFLFLIQLIFNRIIFLKLP